MIFALLLAATVCTAETAAALHACTQAPSKPSEIRLTADVVCTTEAECCPGGSPLVWLSARRGVTLEGGGHTLRRAAGQRVCSAIKISEGTRDVTIRDLTLDEDLGTPWCDVEDYWEGCADTVLVHSSPRVILERVRILHAKSHALHVWGPSDGFAFRNGAILSAGIIGLYVGHAEYPPVPKGVTITGSTFEDVRTNAIAIMGANGATIASNKFARNHSQGLWLNKGQVSGGGQLFVGYGTNVTVRGNDIRDGFCDNCALNYVNGIELGEPGQRLPVRNTLVEGNRISNQNGDGIIMPASTADRSIEIKNNRIINTSGGIVVRGARVLRNEVRRTRDLSMWEKASEFADDWRLSGIAKRWCPGAASVLQAACALRTETGHAQRLVGSLSPGDTVYLSAWRRSGGWQGRACIVFQDKAGRELDATCETSASGAWVFTPISLEAVAPAHTRHVALRLGIVGHGTVDWEAVRVTW